jgi:Fe-S-cluster containining protein
VVLGSGEYTAITEHARGSDGIGADEAFIAQHRHPVTAWRSDDGEDKLDLRCDAFDPVTRLCAARESRPPVCRGYPWYGDDPATSGRAGALYPECSYLADVSPSLRPEGARPLIPLTPA